MPDKEAILDAVARHMDAERLWRMHMEMAEIGATAKGGVCREALTAEDVQARLLLARWGRELGCEVAVDPIGNMFLRRPGIDPDARPVGTGSHLDSQPTGGRFDGTFGVLAGMELLHALNAADIETRHPIEIVNFTNEEGGRFTPGVMGSQVYVRPEELDQMLAVTDLEGTTVASELARFRSAIGPVEERSLASPFAAFIEGHIEQAPLLEETGNQIGIVGGIQGTRKFTVEVVGEEAHAGTMPRRARKDALVAATHMVMALNRLMEDAEDTVRFTIGRFQAFPGAPSVVPGRVRFSLDLRHPDDELRRRLGDRIRPLCEALAGPCTVDVQEPQAADTVLFEGPVTQAIRDSVGRLGLPAMDMFSGAGHDARNVARLCPSGMIFVPCERGISHNEAENAKPEDLTAGAKVITQVVTELALGVA